METFGDLIRIAREEKGLFLRQVAAELEIDQAIISKFERSERKPTKEQVLKFAKFLKINKDKLIVAVWVFISNFENLKEITHSFMAFEVTGKPSALLVI